MSPLGPMPKGGLLAKIDFSVLCVNLFFYHSSSFRAGCAVSCIEGFSGFPLVRTDPMIGFCLTESFLYCRCLEVEVWFQFVPCREPSLWFYFWGFWKITLTVNMSVREKKGKIVRVLREKENRSPRAIARDEFPDHKWMFDGWRLPPSKDGIAYLVEVIVGPKAMSRLYMPYPKNLKRTG